MTSNPKLAVCSCLLKKRNRHNGENAEFRGLNQDWSESFELVEVCPEVELDMGVSSSALRLIKDQERISLINPENGEDHTEAMIKYAEEKSDYLVASGISGFVFSKDSPVFGLEKVMVYCGENQLTITDGAGMFAKVFTTLYPQIPVIEDDDLNDSHKLGNFIARVTLYNRWLMIDKTGWTEEKIQNFHSRNIKLLEGISKEMNSNLIDKSRHPDFIAIDYITEAQKYLADSLKSDSVSLEYNQKPEPELANI
tara:strand:+ start:828 stop:1586 length:759 start_codon:yes stop_codon:yes gene_type:complete